MQRSSTESRISGTLATVDRGESSFEAARPVQGTSPRFSGSYIFLFDSALNGTAVSSRAVVDIEVPTSGIGRSLAAADETDDHGARLGTLDAGECIVSPLESIQCRLPYHGAGTQGPFGGPSVFDAILTGQLLIGPLGVPEGQGTLTVTNQAPITSHAFPLTSWSAIVHPPG